MVKLKRGRSYPFLILKRASEIIDQLLNEFMIGYKCLNKLNNLIKGHKDKDPDHRNNNVVYKINCKDCDTSYVGQTTYVKTTYEEIRVMEHKIEI